MDSLRNMALSMATAGVCHELGGYFNVNMKPGIKDFNVHLQEHAIRNAASLGVHAVVEGKLDGKTVLNSVKDTIIDALAAKGANHLGALPREMFNDQLCHKAGHFVNAFAAGAAKNLDDPFKKGLAAGVGAVGGEIFCETFIDKKETDDEIIGTEIKKARILVGTIAALMGLDVNAADWGTNNAIENNFVPHQLNVDVDVKEPDPEEERGRSSDRDDSEAIRDGSPTSRLDDTAFEEGKRAIGDGYHEVREGQELFKRGEITQENLMKAAGAYSLDGLSYVAYGLDLATFGGASWVGEKLDAGAALAGTGVRRAARYITGDQRFAQNFGDWIYLGLTVANPLNKAALPAQVVQKFNVISNAIKSTKALDALGLEMRLAVNAEGKALKALDLGEAHALKELKIRPNESQNYSTLFRVELKDGVHYPGKSDKLHFQESNKQLYNAMQKDLKLKQSFESMYPGIYNAVKPSEKGVFPIRPPISQGLTWHHNSYEKGMMELIPREHHRAPGPVQRNLHPNQEGGMKIWGGGRNK